MTAGVKFEKDLTISAVSPVAEKAHPAVIPGLKLDKVQGNAVTDLQLNEVMELLKSAPRPLKLSFRAATIVHETTKLDPIVFSEATVCGAFRPAPACVSWSDGVQCTEP